MVFQKGGSVDTVELGTDTWNVASNYVTLKLFKPLWDCDKYEILALYGTEDNSEMLPQELLIQKRIDALYRLKDTIKLIFSNSNFIIRKEDRNNFTSMRKHLETIEGVLDGVSSVEENQATHQKYLIINEKHFRKCLKALQQLKEDLCSPLNNAGIIFRQTDEMSIEDMMKDIVEGG